MAKFYRPEAKPTLENLSSVKVEALDHQLKGVVKHQQKTLFVTGALIDEVVDIKIINQRAKVGEALVTRVIEAHPERLSPPCKHFTRCGDTHLQWSLPRSLAHRTSQLQNLDVWLHSCLKLESAGSQMRLRFISVRQHTALQ